MDTTNVIVVKEDNEKLEKIWESMHKKEMAFGQTFINGAPVAIKVTSPFSKEATPSLESLAAFLNSKTGQKVAEASLNDTLTNNFIKVPTESMEYTNPARGGRSL